MQHPAPVNSGQFIPHLRQLGTMLNEAKANQTQFLLKLIPSVSCRSRSNLGQTKNQHSEPTQNCHDSRNLNPMSDPTGWIANQHSLPSVVCRTILLVLVAIITKRIPAYTVPRNTVYATLTALLTRHRWPAEGYVSYTQNPTRKRNPSSQAGFFKS